MYSIEFAHGAESISFMPTAYADRNTLLLSNYLIAVLKIGWTKIENDQINEEIDWKTSCDLLLMSPGLIARRRDCHHDLIIIAVKMVGMHLPVII